jgi:tRNA(Ile)-lysidine synthase
MDRLFTGWATMRGVVAVSGGADSAALLRALIECGATVTVAHLNHQLRGAESDADEMFVIELANVLGVPVRIERIDVAVLGGNLEATARRVRYEWLTKIATEVNAGWIATGHTADDQAETVLHRLIRGTGLQGLRGIASFRRDQRERALPAPAGRDEKGAVLLRPLLFLPRVDLLAYLESVSQSFRTDSSNADTRFTRNRIRAELLPLLRTFNPGIVDVLNRLSVQAEELFAEQETETAKLLADVELPRAGDMLILNATKLPSIGEAKVRAALRMLWDREGWPTQAMTFDHWKRAAAIALGQHPAADFPDGVHVRRNERVVQLEQNLISPPRAHKDISGMRKF